MNSKTKKILVLGAFILFSLSLFLLFYTLGGLKQGANMSFAYIAGLTMIVLPCTLPLAFVIVPIAINKGFKKGLLMSLAFGFGISITLSLYGLFVALAGKSLGLDDAIAKAGVVSSVLFMVGGLSAFVFGLSELGLVKFKMPSYGGSYPKFIQRQGDYIKMVLLGLFLGNAGVGCPNPLFYVLLGDIAVQGSIASGWWLGFVHGLGRVTPLVFLVILGMLGINATRNIAQKTALVSKWTGIILIFLGSLIFIMGASHKWYENSVVHKGWNRAIVYITGENSKVVEREALEGEVAESHDHEEKDDYIPEPWSWITLIAMITIPLVIYKFKKKKV